MRYPLQPTPPRTLAKVVAGNASDARWRDVPVLAGIDFGTPDSHLVIAPVRIDSTRRHELAKTARKS